MAQAQPVELFSEWTNEGTQDVPGPKKALEDLYDSLGSMIGMNIEAADIPEGATFKQIQYYNAAAEFVVGIDLLKKQFEKKYSWSGGNGSLSDGGWPSNDLSIFTYEYYEQNVIPAVLQIVEDIKVIQENVTVSAPDSFNVNAPGSDDNPFKFGKAPPEDLPETIDKVLDAIQDFIQNFPSVSVSFKKVSLLIFVL